MTDQLHPCASAAECFISAHAHHGGLPAFLVSIDMRPAPYLAEQGWIQSARMTQVESCVLGMWCRIPRPEPGGGNSSAQHRGSGGATKKTQGRAKRTIEEVIQDDERKAAEGPRVKRDRLESVQPAPSLPRVGEQSAAVLSQLHTEILEFARVVERTRGEAALV